MKKELITLSFLSSIVVLVYFLFPNFQENIKKDTFKKLEEKSETNKSVKSNTLSEKNEINLTFDIVRISKKNDAILAGKSEPNIQIQLLNHDKEIANFFSDGNGEWIWVSDLPLSRGIKKFRLKHKKRDGTFIESTQTIVILNNKESESKPIIAKVLDKKNYEIDMLNLDSISDGLSLDIVDYNPNGSLSIKGRTKPNQKVSFRDSSKIVGKIVSNKNGEWNFTIDKFDLISIVSIETNINGKNLIIPFSQLNLNEYAKVTDLEFEDKKIVVEEGNSLWRIARKNLGGGIYYSEIYFHNSQRIENPDLIYPGQVFNMPNIQRKTFYE